MKCADTARLRTIGRIVATEYNIEAGQLIVSAADELDTLRAGLEAIGAGGVSARSITKPASEQEGWVLVPVTPTQEMVQAGYWSGSGDVSVNQAWARKEVWARMISSAPKPDE